MLGAEGTRLHTVDVLRSSADVSNADVSNTQAVSKKQSHTKTESLRSLRRFQNTCMVCARTAPVAVRKQGVPSSAPLE